MNTRRFAWLVVLVMGCTPRTATLPMPAKVGDAPATSATSAALESQIAAFCGDCHAFPKPDTFPRDAWPGEIERGFGLYFESRRTDLKTPRIIDVVRYYRDRAPPILDIPPPAPESSPPPATFHRVDGEPGDSLLMPATSNIHFVASRADRPACLLTCDMRSGDVRRVTFAKDAISGEPLARLANPAHIEECDLDCDGAMDLLVAELGSLDPADHADGKVIWLRRDQATEKYQTRVLAEKLGRVADVRPADFDGDGDLDLVVAEFGWHQTGRILLLVNRGATSESFQFDLQVLHPFPGAIHVPPCDLNQDGLVDFVALVSQHQETVIAFLNRGDGSFARETIWSAGDPSFGSSGIELVDLDQDGDLDVLGTSGDTFDNKHIKPYHGTYWLENEGTFPFRPHFLAAIPGAYRALAGDVDGDGDLDVVTVAFLPHEPLAAIDISRYHSVTLLEQRAPGEFQRHGVESGRFDHATFVMGDFDEDGDLDLAIGEFPRNGAAPHPRFRLWWNERTARPQ